MLKNDEIIARLHNGMNEIGPTMFLPADGLKLHEAARLFNRLSRIVRSIEKVHSELSQKQYGE